MCILDIILARLYDSDDKPFVTESNGVSKKRCPKDERNGTVSIPETSEEESVAKQKDLNGNNKTMAALGGVLGVTLGKMCSSAEAESSEYSGLKPKNEKSEDKWPNWNKHPEESSSHNWNQERDETYGIKWNKKE